MFEQFTRRDSLASLSHRPDACDGNVNKRLSRGEIDDMRTSTTVANHFQFGRNEVLRVEDGRTVRAEGPSCEELESLASLVPCWLSRKSGWRRDLKEAEQATGEEWHRQEYEFEDVFEGASWAR
jgi:hypothetical protein